MTGNEHELDGLEAYRDDATYTAPEMQPGNGVDIVAEPHREGGLLTAAGWTIGVAGGAMAGESLALSETANERDRQD